MKGVHGAGLLSGMLGPPAGGIHAFISGEGGSVGWDYSQLLQR